LAAVTGTAKEFHNIKYQLLQSNSVLEGKKKTMDFLPGPGIEPGTFRLFNLFYSPYTTEHGTLTDGEGSVPFTSFLRQLVL
jgi:hypothetical protein